MNVNLLMHPIDILTAWLEEEKIAGAINAQHAVLSTKGIDGHPHGRVIAIREINDDGLIFFTQKVTRKVEEMKACSLVSLTFWFELLQRQVMIEGGSEFLLPSENEQYWNTYPKSAQIRFHSYAPTSGLPIQDKQILEDKKTELQRIYQNKNVPISPDYCGILIKPTRFLFYAYRLDELSDVWDYQIKEQGWVKNLLSP